MTMQNKYKRKFTLIELMIVLSTIVGNYITAVEITDGAIHITLGNNVNKHVLGKTASIRPAVAAVSAKVPIAWIRGYAPVPAGMAAKGENRTDLLP